MSEIPAATALMAVAAEAWPASWVPRAVFAAYVHERASAEDKLSEGAIGAMYLACACLRGVAPALKAFDEKYLPDIRRAGARAGLDPDGVAELAQALREELLVGRNGSRATLGDYRGRGDLAGWVRVVATRAAVKMKKRAPHRSSESDLERFEARAAEGDPELSYMKAAYRDAFRSAFQSAAASLEARERKILYQHTIEGMSIDQIGAAHGVHRATAARWVQAARESLLLAVRREFKKQMNVSSHELASVLRLVESRLDMTLRGLLA
jgi:RNA polymerase sigma-70 factor (ECF subfamily)